MRVEMSSFSVSWQGSNPANNLIARWHICCGKDRTLWCLLNTHCPLAFSIYIYKFNIHAGQKGKKRKNLRKLKHVNQRANYPLGKILMMQLLVIRIKLKLGFFFRVSLSLSCEARRSCYSLVSVGLLWYYLYVVPKRCLQVLDSDYHEALRFITNAKAITIIVNCSLELGGLRCHPVDLSTGAYLFIKWFWVCFPLIHSSTPFKKV